jgi:hypothetical protein
LAERRVFIALQWSAFVGGSSAGGPAVGSFLPSPKTFGFWRWRWHGEHGVNAAAHVVHLKHACFEFFALREHRVYEVVHRGRARASAAKSGTDVECGVIRTLLDELNGGEDGK